MDKKDIQPVVEVVDRYIDAISRGDVDAVVELFGDQGSIEDPVGSEPVSGIEAIKAFYAEGLSNSPKLIRTGPVRVAGQEVAFPFKAETPDGDIDIIDTFLLDDNLKIVKMRAYWGEKNFNPR